MNALVVNGSNNSERAFGLVAGERVAEALNLGLDDAVEGGVGLPVAAAVEASALGFAGGCLDRAGSA